jgi:hypothetical protein
MQAGRAGPLPGRVTTRQLLRAQHERMARADAEVRPTAATATSAATASTTAITATTATTAATAATTATTATTAATATATTASATTTAVAACLRRFRCRLSSAAALC